MPERVSFGIRTKSLLKGKSVKSKRDLDGAFLEKGWVIANHILVSFHVAFISSVLSIPTGISTRGEVLKYMFNSTETLISIFFWYFTFHAGIAIHEIGHYIRAVKINALNEVLLPDAQSRLSKGFLSRMFWSIQMFLCIPLGQFKGIEKTGLDYHPDAPYNLAVSAAGPAASRNLALVMLPAAVLFLIFGLAGHNHLTVYAGRLTLGIGFVSLLDFLLADHGKYREFRRREKEAVQKAARVSTADNSDGKTWKERVQKVKNQLVYTRMQTLTLLNGQVIFVPWEYRNCGMGGRHTEKEFPESNISLQESMFIPLNAANYEEAQEMTVNLQTRLKEIIENAEGCTVKGVGTEGGIVPYIMKDQGDILPVQRLWRMQKKAIEECGYIPGKDVVIVIDSAASELETAYRENTGLSDVKGMYMAWRDKEQRVLSRDDLLKIYCKAIEEDDLPIVSIEDGFAEDDDEGWRLLMKSLGDRIIIVGDDNITTKDASIEYSAEEQLINAALIKLNQIGTVTEGILAMLTGIGKNLELVVSHRSKSPIEDFEAQVALAAQSLGLKCGGGSNSERVYKYESVTRIIRDAIQRMEKVSAAKANELTESFIRELVITGIVAREASTNTGIPTVGVEVKVGIPGHPKYEKLLIFEGSTPLGTSAGTGEAIHLIDSIIEKNGTVEKYPDLFDSQTDLTCRFKKSVTNEIVSGKKDKDLSELWRRANRYNGKGCLNAVDNITTILSRLFVGEKVSALGDISEIDRMLLQTEYDTAVKRNKLNVTASVDDRIDVMQKKANLGMNAILPLSLALARMKGALDGKHLWEVIRDQMNLILAKTIAKFIDNAFLEVFQNHMFDRRIKQKETASGISVTKEESEVIRSEVEAKTKIIGEALQNDKSQTGWKILCRHLSFEELSVGLRIVNTIKKKDQKLYQLLRDQVSIYRIPAS